MIHQEAEKPGFVKVVFDYPFHIGVPDDYYPVKLDEDHAMVALIHVSSREGLQIFDKGKLLRNQREDGKTNLILLDINTSSKTSEIVGSNGNDLPVFWVVAGKHGRASYPWFFNEIEVIFPINHVYVAWAGSENSKYLNDLVMKFFNKFLLAYRYTSHDVFNKFLSHDEAFTAYKALYVSEFSEEERKVSSLKLLTISVVSSRAFKPFPIRPNMKDGEIPLVESKISPPWPTNAKKEEIDGTKVSELKLIGAGPIDVKPFNKMLLSGMERYAMDKDYSMAMVDFDTAVEMTISYYLKKILLRQGLSEVQFLKLFDETNRTSRNLQRNGKGYLTTFARLSRLNEQLNAILKQNCLAEVKLRDSTQFSDWNSLVRKKRNAIVHEGKRFDEDECKKAFDAAQKFLRLIQKVGDECLQTTI